MDDPRTPCLNPRCRRTFKREHEDEIQVCRKCWLLLPAVVRERYKQMRRRARLIERLKAKGMTRRRGRRHGHPDRGEPQWHTLERQWGRLWVSYWTWIVAFYRTPEKPIGLDAFLEEMRL